MEWAYSFERYWSSWTSVPADPVQCCGEDRPVLDKFWSQQCLYTNYGCDAKYGRVLCVIHQGVPEIHHAVSFYATFLVETIANPARKWGIQRAVQYRRAAPLWYCTTRRHTPRVCGYDVSTVTLKSEAFTSTSFFSYIFSRATIAGGSRALLSLWPPFMIFDQERRWEAAMYEVTWHLLTLRCYVSFGYCDTTEALQAATEQCS